MFRLHALVLSVLLAAAWPSTADAQQTQPNTRPNTEPNAQQPVQPNAQPSAQPNAQPNAPQTVEGYTLAAKTQVRVGENHLQLTGEVELEQGDTKLYADSVELFTKEDRVIATGNVVLTQGSNRIAADRADFNTKTRLGTFYNASGVATVKPPKTTRPQGGGMGMAPPPIAGQQQNEVYFFGDKVEKTGPKKYRISNGGFSTCVQPTPRWDLHADTVVLNIDHYTLLTQAILNVKGVPMLYLPFMYYPTKEDQRATGILIPTYGTSTIRGQSIHNAFFWAIDRSQDMTFLHDWFSKTGNGVGSEYRYNWGGGADGNIRGYFLDQQAATYDLPDGTTSSTAGSRSFELRGNANQPLPGGFRARARVDYFSSITTMQTFNTNVYDASRNQRTYGGNIVGAWHSYSLNGTFDRTEYFYDSQNSAVTGGAPRISLTRTERPLFGQSPVYVSFASEFAHIDNERISPTVDDNRNLERVDFTPQVRYPFKRWQWFTVDSSLSWRDTFYTRSNDAAGVITNQSLNRRYFTGHAQVVGPVFTRVWDTPDNGYAEKFKHTIEPFFDALRTSSIDNFAEIVQFDGTDTVVGGTTNYTYGLRNRFYAKRRPGPDARPGQVATAQEIVTVEVRQSYYTNQLASQFDAAYQTSYSGAAPSKFSPIQANVRAAPTTSLSATASAEIDSQYLQLRTLSLRGTYNWTNRVQTDVGWSRKFTIPQLGTAFATPDHFITASTNARTLDNKYGILYSMNFDVLHSALLQERISAFYNAQCCGISAEYQRYNFNGLGSAVPVPADHRFFLSFTLAGLGNFSPFNGAMGGVPR